MSLLAIILILILIVALFGGFGFRTGRYGYSTYPSYYYGGGLVWIVLLIILVLLLTGYWR